MRKPAKKLALNKESIRNLTSHKLMGARGGLRGSDGTVNDNSVSCAYTCGNTCACQEVQLTISNCAQCRGN